MPTPSPLTPSSSPVLRPLREVEQEHVLAILDHCHGNRTEAARVLGIDRKTLYRMLLRWEAEAPIRRPEAMTAAG